MTRFSSTDVTSTPALATILYDEFPALRDARAMMDARIEAFVAGLTEAYLRGVVRYHNNAGKYHEDSIPLVLQHMFNHATHHRGQVHVMLSQYGQTVNLDMHRAIHPDWQAVPAG